MMCISQFVPEYEEEIGFPENLMLHDLTWCIYICYLIHETWSDAELPI